MAASPTDPQPSLRERKKQQTKQALERAAFELFARQGYAETTVEDIAAVAQVSRASFFRYFGSKEDVLAADDDLRRERFMAALIGQPDELPPLDAVRAAVTEYLLGLAANDELRGRTYAKVIMGSRVLLGRAFEIRMRWLAELEAELLRRLGRRVDAATTAAMLADLVLGVLETCLRLVTADPDRQVTDLLDRGFALLVTEIA